MDRSEGERSVPPCETLRRKTAQGRCGLEGGYVLGLEAGLSREATVTPRDTPVPFPTLLGMTAKTDRQTDSAGLSVRPQQPGQDRCGRAEADPLCTRGLAGTGALSDALLHRVHGDVVVVAAHGQVRLRRRGG